MKQIELGLTNFLAGKPSRRRPVMAKVIQLKQHFANYKTLGVKLQNDMYIGEIEDLGNLASDLSKKKKLKKGSSVTISLVKVMFRGILVKVQAKGMNGFAFVDDRCALETAMKKRFATVMKTVHICSILPQALRDELIKLQIKVYKENSKGRQEYAKVVTAINEKLAA